MLWIPDSRYWIPDSLLKELGVRIPIVKGRTIRKLIGGGGEAKYQKKYSRKGKLNEKNSCTPINPKKYSCYGLKKNSYKEFDNAKKFLRLENSPPSPHNFSNGPSLKRFSYDLEMKTREQNKTTRERK